MAWGSTIGAVRDAMRLLNNRGHPTNLVHLPTVYPIHGAELLPLLQGAKRLLLVEANFTGQLGHLIRAETGFTFQHKFLKYDGEPFTPSEIATRAMEVINVR